MTLSRLSVCFFRCWLVSVATWARSSSPRSSISRLLEEVAHRGAPMSARNSVSPSSRAFSRSWMYSSSSRSCAGLTSCLPGFTTDVGRVVDHLLEIAQRHPQQIAHLRRQRLEEPDVRDGHGELDVPHPLAPHLRQRHLDAALVADHPAIADPLELPAVALPVLDRTEDPLAEEAVPLRLERAVVDRLRLRDLTEAPRADLVRRGELHLDEVEVRRACFSVRGKSIMFGVPLLYASSRGSKCETVSGETNGRLSSYQSSSRSLQDRNANQDRWRRIRGHRTTGTDGNWKPTALSSPASR
jgi:hypothetical protein